VYFHDDCGHLREIPAVWTDFVKGDVFVEIAASRSPLHARCMLELADLVERMARELGRGATGWRDSLSAIAHGFSGSLCARRPLHS
jgi:hypothetical protein